MKLPFEMDLKGKVAVVTGAGGILCFSMAQALAECGAKVALLDLNQEAANENAERISEDGGIAKGYQANVLEKESLQEAHQSILTDFGPCDILINGAGGNHPLATTDKEYFETKDLDEDVKTFFDLAQNGVEFVFNLNFLGTLLPTQEFSKDMIGRKNCSILNISSMNAYTPLTKIPAYSGAKAAVSNFTQWLAVHFAKEGIRVRRWAPGSPNHMNDFYIIKMEVLPHAPVKFLPLPRWGVLAKRRNYWEVCCFYSMRKRQDLSQE